MLLYRRNKTNGSWAVKASDGHGAYWTTAFANADDYENSDGTKVLTFYEAQDKAKKLARRGGDAASDTAPITVAGALADYQTDLKARGANPRNATWPRVHLPSALLVKPVQLLTSKELRKWRDLLLDKVKPPPSTAFATPCARRWRSPYEGLPVSHMVTRYPEPTDLDAAAPESLIQGMREMSEGNNTVVRYFDFVDRQRFTEWLGTLAEHERSRAAAPESTKGKRKPKPKKIEVTLAITRHLYLKARSVADVLEIARPKTRKGLAGCGRPRTMALELMRLDQLEMVFEGSALKDKDVPAGVLMVKIAERRATLLGLNPPLGMLSRSFSMSLQPSGPRPRRRLPGRTPLWARSRARTDFFGRDDFRGGP